MTPPNPTPTPKPTPPPVSPPGFNLDASQMAQFAGMFNAASDDAKPVWLGAKGGKNVTQTVKQLTDTFVNALFDASDPKHVEAANRFQQLFATGAFGKNPDKKDVYNGYRKIFLDAANVYNNNKGRKVSWLDNYANNLAVMARYQTAAKTPQTVSKTVSTYTDAEASALGTKAFTETFDRTPTGAELAAFKKNLLAAANAAPSITEVKNGTTYTKGGFDQNTWVAAYMSGLLPHEKNKTDLNGAAGTWQDKIRETLNDYGISQDPVGTLNDVRDLINGKLTEENLVQRIQGQAKGKFGPAMAQAIDAGNTVRQVVQPLLSQYADMMEVSADSVNVGDIASMATVGEGNQQRIATTNEFASKIRQMSDWSRTTNAKSEAYNLGQSVLQMFGLVK